MLSINKKGQVAVLDLFIAAVIFGVLVTTIMLTWNEYNVRIEEHIDYNDLVIKAVHITDLLSQYPGKPTGWEGPRVFLPKRNTITTIGLASDEGIIDENKLDRFLNLTYNETRDIFNIKSYDYFFKIIKVDGSNFSPSIEKGILTNKTIVSIRRLVIYKDDPAILQFQLEE